MSVRQMYQPKTSTLFLLFLCCFTLFAAPGWHGPTMAVAHLHKWKVLMNTIRSLQESMLRTSLDRAQPNYDIIFECRTKRDMRHSKDVHFHLRLGDMSGFQRLNPRRKLALFLHGWNDEGSKGWIQEMLKTWTHFMPHYSVCVVDWGHLSQMDYKTATMSIFDVGLTVAAIIRALEDLRPYRFDRRNITVAGYSLGAHAAGYAGATLNGELEQIIGLDPAGPLFTLPAVVSERYRLDQTDAQYVQVLHTSSGTLGTNLKCGDADFFPNGGKAPQPNCRRFNNFNDMHSNPIACSHSSAAVFFKQSMDPMYPFMGHHCSNYENYALGLCAYNHKGRFGVHSKRNKYGNFYFNTDTSAPYVRRLAVKQLTSRRQLAPARRRHWQRLHHYR